MLSFKALICLRYPAEVEIRKCFFVYRKGLVCELLLFSGMSKFLPKTNHMQFGKQLLRQVLRRLTKFAMKLVSSLLKLNSGDMPDVTPYITTLFQNFP